MLSDISHILPVIILSVVGLLILIEEITLKNTAIAHGLAVAGMVAALAISMVDVIGPSGLAFNDMYAYGGAAAFGNIVILLGTLFSTLLSKDYLASIDHSEGEVYALMSFAAAGMLVLAGANDLVTVFIGLETMSVCLYVLAGLVKNSKEGIEAALKYFLLGAFSTGFLLYGIALLYGATGSTNFQGIAAGISNSYLFWAGTSLLLVGFLFKVSAVPFHMWTPDVYQGSPTTITAFMATASKSATFVSLTFVLSRALGTTGVEIAGVLTVVAILTMIFGNIIAIVQDNVKRMLAYSSIAHAGYALVGLTAATPQGYNAVLFYLFAYTIMNVGAFGVIAFFEKNKQLDFTHIDSYAGLGYKQPVMGIMLSIFLFSLAGIPPFVGFIGKYKVFAAAINEGFIGLAIIGVLASAASVYYYLRVMIFMYMKEGKEELEATNPSFLFQFSLILLTLFTIYFGIVPTDISSLLSNIEWSAAVASVIP